MSKLFKVETEDGIRFFFGTTNDLRKVIRDLEESGEAVSYYTDRPILRTGRHYMLMVVNGFYTVYKEEA